ncbi:MAG: ABC transporter substrate-binding protein [Actinomycetota bacterium]
MMNLRLHRAVAALAASVLLLAGCGGGDDDGEEAEAVEITLTDVTGEVTLPVTDSGVYALDEFAGIALLTLDVQPAVVEAFFQDMTLGPIIESEGVTLAAAGGLEPIAAAEPELILGIGHPNLTELKEQHVGIAPVAYPDFTLPWTDQTEQFAAAVGRSDRGEAVVAVIEERLEEVKAKVAEAGLDGARASLIQPFGNEYYAYGPTTLAGTVLADLGFTRSEIQSGAGDFGFIQVSEELLGDETDAELVISLSADDGAFGSLFNSPVVNPGDDAFTGDVGDAWVSNTALSAWIILNDIEAIIVTGEDPATSADVLDQWSSLKERIDAAS